MNADNEGDDPLEARPASFLELVACGKLCFRDVQDPLVRKLVRRHRFPTRQALSTMMCEAGDAMVDTRRHEFALRRPVQIACQFDPWSGEYSPRAIGLHIDVRTEDGDITSGVVDLFQFPFESGSAVNLAICTRRMIEKVIPCEPLIGPQPVREFVIATDRGAMSIRQGICSQRSWSRWVFPVFEPALNVTSSTW
jgi:hypothetical protein